MARHAPGTVAVIFASQRTGEDEVGYAEAASAMDRRAARQPGYRGMDDARDADGFGITISYWADEVAAIAWRDDLDHRKTRDRGRSIWYSRYSVVVATVTRSYDWSRADPLSRPEPAACPARRSRSDSSPMRPA